MNIIYYIAGIKKKRNKSTFQLIHKTHLIKFNIVRNEHFQRPGTRKELR